MDHVIAWRAERQHGIVAAWQLLRIGLTQDDIDYRVRVGRLRRLHRGVYAVGHAALTVEGEILAAVLAVGEGAAAGGPSALVLWGVRKRRAGEPIYVTVARHVRAPRGVEVTWVQDLPEWSMRHGIRVLMPEPALLECASILGERDLRRAVNQALVEKRVSVPSLVALVARSGGRRGVGQLGRVLANAKPARSDLEDALVAYLVAHGIEGFETNAYVGPDEVDAVWRAERVVVEADGGTYHDNPIARANDAAKQGRLEAAGYVVVRLRWRDLTVGQARVAARLRRRLQTAAGSNP